MTADEFRATLTQKTGGKVRFVEVGKNGWTTVEDALGGRPGGRPGPHWIDAAPIPRTQRLLARYDCLTGEATFFCDL